MRWTAPVSASPSNHDSDAAIALGTAWWAGTRRLHRWLGARRVTGGVLVILAAVALVAAYVVPEAGGGGELTIGAALLLGLVEGLTEWLPISSTGHLTVTQELLGIDGAAATSYAIAVQAGAILAVVSLYRHRFAAMARGALGSDPAGRRVLLAVLTAAVPAAVVGLALEDVIKDRLFGPWPVVIAWFAGGLAILAMTRTRRLTSSEGAPLGALGGRGALAIGMAQILALWPGVSRSLVTIVAAVIVGLALPAAVEFSFLLGFVMLGGATFYETLGSGAEMVEAYGVVTPLVGLSVAFGSALVAMRWMVGYLNRSGFGVFGWYRIGLALVVSALLVTGAL